MTEAAHSRPPHSEAARRSLPFATRLFWLVLSIIIPSLLIAAGGLYSAYDAEKSATEELLLRATRTLAQHLDQEFLKLKEAARAVTNEPLPEKNPRNALLARLAEQPLLGGVNVAVGPLEGPPRFHRNGEALAAASQLRAVARQQALDGGKPVISLHQTGANATPMVLLDAAFPARGGEREIATFELGPEVWARIISGGVLGNNEWNGAAISGQGHVIARTGLEPLFVQPVAPLQLLERMHAAPEGVAYLTGPRGRSMTAVYSRTPNHDWSFVIVYPQHRLRAALNRSLAWLGALGLVAVVGFGHVYYLSGQLVRPVARLTASARRLARNEVMPVQRTGVTEFDDIQLALRDASQQLARRNSERDQVEAMLRASEQRLRLAMEASELGAWSYDPDKNELMGSERSRQLLGLPPGRVDLETLAGALHPALRADHQQAVARAVRGREPFVVEVCVQWPDGSVHWVEVRGRPVMRQGGPPTVVGIVHEVTERRSAADRQRMLLRELNHRVKNSLATVQSIALLTRRSTAPEHAWETFEDRLVGLAKTHDLLTASEWRGAWIDDALRAELTPYQGEGVQRIRAEGPRLRLNPRATLSLCMCFHELATNAAKYGALSTDQGRVEIRWRITPADSQSPAMLHVTWRERGGPEVSPPTRQGLGSRLLDRALRRELGGRLDLHYAPEGLECSFSVPLQAVSADAAEEARAAQ